ncbi:MAG: hypothetical protein GXP33_14720 [Spirochaetes bacterium]|nr:hypothetical protein [Spirochaetota bacterium]
MSSIYGFFLIISLNLVIVLSIFLVLKKRIDSISDSRLVLKDIRDEVDRMLVELNQTTERNIALLEDKLVEVHNTLDRVDNKLKLLDRGRDKQDLTKRVYTDIEKSKPAVTQKRDLQQEVLNLYHSGLTESIIAKRLNLPIGEVQLIISLSATRG